jgi:hypothetical protein
MANRVHNRADAILGAYDRLAVLLCLVEASTRLWHHDLWRGRTANDCGAE